MSPPPVVTLLDTRIRVKLWNDPVDPCEAIFFHDAIPTSFSNPDAMLLSCSTKSGRQA